MGDHCFDRTKFSEKLAMQFFKFQNVGGSSCRPTVRRTIEAYYAKTTRVQGLNKFPELGGASRPTMGDDHRSRSVTPRIALNCFPRNFHRRLRRLLLPLKFFLGHAV